MPQQIGVVLAGGRGERLGRSKATVELDGATFVDRAARTLSPLCASVLVSVAPGENPAPEYPRVEDERPAGCGPLAGLAAAFKVTGTAHLLVLACDYPRVGTELMRRVAEVEAPDSDLVLVTDENGRDHPLVALWRRSCAEAVVDALTARRYKVRGLLAELRVLRMGPFDFGEIDLQRGLLNVNDPDDLVAAQSASPD